MASAPRRHLPDEEVREDPATRALEIASIGCRVKGFAEVSGMLDQVFKSPPPNSDPKTQERLMPRLGDLVKQLLQVVPQAGTMSRSSRSPGTMTCEC